MVSWIKTIFKSGIIGDYISGALTVKPDNTIERIVCVRTDDASRQGPVIVHEPSHLLTSMLCTQAQERSYFDSYDLTYGIEQQSDSTHDTRDAHKSDEVVEPLPFFRSTQDIIIRSLFGLDHTYEDTQNVCGTVYIEYWYESTRHVTYYTLPGDTITFPLYPKSTQDTACLIDDDDMITSATCCMTASKQGTKRRLDMTSTVLRFAGPKMDFHGRDIRAVDFSLIIDYHQICAPIKLMPSQLIGSQQRMEILYGSGDIKTIPM